jgi:hypothetical protein
MTRSTGPVTRRTTVSRGALVVFFNLLLLVCSLLVGYFYGRELAKHPLDAANKLIQDLQPETRRLTAIVNGQNTQIATLEARLKSLEASMHEMSPAEDTYRIGPNQAVGAAHGRLTLGLVGPPTNRSIVLNINGKQYTAASGDIFNVALDASTNCEVKVLSFDTFSALLSAVCKAKTQ